MTVASSGRSSHASVPKGHHRRRVLLLSQAREPRQKLYQYSERHHRGLILMALYTALLDDPLARRGLEICS
jgi:hypothetical protein